MAVTIFRSSDPDAPTLTGEIGSLVNLLDKTLVAGYTGKSAAGWSKPYVTAAHSAVFQQGAGNGFFLDVNDNGPGAGTYKEARVRGYETMSAVSTGTGLFPTVAQAANGLFPRKSVAATAVPRAWIMFADDRTFYLMVLTGDTAGLYYCWGFGDLFSLLTGDGYRTMIVGKTTENAATNTGALMASGAPSISTASAGIYAARIAAGTGTSIGLGKTGLGTSSAVQAVVFPTPDSSLYLHRLWLADGGTPGTLRGYLRGVWQIIGDTSYFNDGDTFSGSGALSAYTFKIIKTADLATINLAVETSAWAASS